MTEGLKGTLSLIDILKPKRIILLGLNAFKIIEKTIKDSSTKIEYTSVYSNIKSQVGRINNIPTVCVPHPSGKWEVSNKFIPMFIFLHKLAEITNKKNTIKPLKEVVEIMKTEMRSWQDHVIVTKEIGE